MRSPVPTCRPTRGSGIVLEDHYWDDSDAAVVFQRTDTATGAARYVYHGNDGTSFPWNDTAQLDFLDPAVREQVIRAIIDVARRFPIIRFDAAMVLAKKHIQRLWWPEPGTGGGIPSRAEHALTKAEFDARMPVEFWREVVDRVAAEVPGTLLLAEAFWLLEGYFVRTLGMHRVYNSAFMHMLRDEDVAGYRKTIKETIEFDPEILKRYVNFMSNPDEKTAIEQFGKGDKYFGVATVLATLPGLPMLGHGQVQGFGEKYGMEFRRAMLDEQPDPWLVARHEREIFPLLHKRAWFAEAADFLLYDFTTPGGHVDEGVLAYSNGSGRERSLVLYHDRFGSTTGRIHRSSPYAVKSPTGAKRKVRRSLAEGLGLPNDPAAFLVFRDARTGLEYLRSCREIWERGFEISLDAYTAHVFWEFRRGLGRRGRPVGQAGRAPGRPGRPVAGRGDARAPARADPRSDAGGLRRRPHGRRHRRRGQPGAARRAGAPLRRVPGGHRRGDRRHRRSGADRSPDPRPRRAGVRRDGPVGGRCRTDRRRGRRQGGTRGGGQGGQGGDAARATRRRAPRPSLRSPSPPAPAPAIEPGLGRRDRATLLAWLTLSQTGVLAPRGKPAATSLAWYDELRMPGALVAGLHDVGFDEGVAWAITDRVRVLLALPRPSTIGAPVRTAPARLLEAWLAIEPVRVAIGLNTWEGVEYLDRDQFQDLLGWAVRLETIESEAPGTTAASSAVTAHLSAAADVAGYRVDRIRAALAASPPPAGRRPPGRLRSGRARPDPSRCLAQQDPPQQRGRRRAVGDDRFEVRPVGEARRLAEVPDDPRLRDGRRAARVAGRDRGPAAHLALDVPHLHRAREVGRQLGRRQPRPIELGARLGLLLEAAVDHQPRPPRPRSSRRSGSSRR